MVGLQWGDEGKGKIVDILAARHDATVRYNGGANAGHTVSIKGERYALHVVPSGILTPGKHAVIGNGVVVDPESLLKEIDGLRARGVDVSNLVVSDRAHVVLPYHKDEDAIRETILTGVAEDEHTDPGAEKGDRSIGTTRRGIGPAYADKIHRATAIRVGDLLRPEALGPALHSACAMKSRTIPRIPSTPTAPSQEYDPESLLERLSACGERLRPHITDTVYMLHGLLDAGKSLLFEGANATLLDVDHGTFPYVTSSSTTVLGIGPGTGVSERRVGSVVGVMKAYCTRVGAGPFPTELRDATGERIRERGREYGTTTGRPRRTGWLDLVALRYAVMVNSVTTLSIMLLDVLSGFDEIKVCVAYRIDGVETDRFHPDARVLVRAEPVYVTLPGFAQDISAARSYDELPPTAKAYVERIESSVGVPVGIVSVGPNRDQTLFR
ncbi:MAG: adenylosuccinate synthase [Phycisphaerales bacterium]|nr:MAG: adenylosuccinate synthase [Phycisphaerales bacterium]